MTNSQADSRQGSRSYAAPLLLALLLLAGFALRLLYGPLLGLPERGPEQGFVVDEQEYYGAASLLAEGRGFSFHDTFTWTRAPLYIVFLAAIFRFAGKNLELVFLIQAAMSTLTVALLAWLAGNLAGTGKHIRPWRARLITAAVGSFWLSFTMFSELLLSETLFLLLFVAALCLLALHFSNSSQGVSRWLPIAGAGLLLGLAALTRSTAIAFVPLAALVVAWPKRGAKVALLPALILLAAVGLVVTPWIARTYAAYGSLVLVDTSGAYNLWLASTGVRDGERLAGELSAIDGPIAKQDFAYQQAFNNIAAGPGGFVVKGLKESWDLWAINPTAEERRTGGFSQGRVPAMHLLSLFVLEDLLYVVIVGLALGGLFFAPANPLNRIALLWVLLWIVMAFVFFAVNRFRFPMIAALLPWVPIGAAQLARGLRSMIGAVRRLRLPFAMRSVLPVLLVIPLLFTLPGSFTELGIQRWYSQVDYRAAERALVSGDLAVARTLYQQANQELRDTLFGLAATDIISNSDKPTLLQEVAARPGLAADFSVAGTARVEPFLLRGEIASLFADETAAATFWSARPIDDNPILALDWVSRHLLPRPTDMIDVGSDLDVPYLNGFYTAESYAEGDYRWSSADVYVRTTFANDGLTVRWSGWRPGGVAIATIEVWWRVCENQRTAPVWTCDWQRGPNFSLPTTDTWQEDSLQTPAGAEIRFVINGFVPGGFDPRELGVRIDWLRAGTQ